MQVKVFESPDMATGLRMVRNELGADALILSTRSIRNSKLGILGKSMLEITAAIDETVPSFNNGSGSFGLSAEKHSATTPFYRKNNSTKTDRTGTPNSLFSLSSSNQSGEPKTTPHFSENKEHQNSGQDVNRELDELKSMIRSLSTEVSRLKPAKPLKPQTDHSTAIESTIEEHPQSPEKVIVSLLCGYGISTETSNVIADLALDSLSDEELSDPEKLSSFFQEITGGFIHVSPPDFTESNTQKRIAFVGPTGVGKTTTLAKIAALCIGRFRKSVALITIDTYRIAAVEQLKVYGEIMNLPVDVVLTPGQFKKAVHKHRDKDVILIDTAGRSPKDIISIEELSTFLTDDLEIEKHLVLSAGTRDSELIEAVSHFQKLNLDKTIFTKIDECTHLGVILNTQLKNPTPLSYITNGQRVPEDILQIDREAVARLVIPSIQGNTP